SQEAKSIRRILVARRWLNDADQVDEEVDAVGGPAQGVERQRSECAQRDHRELAHAPGAILPAGDLISQRVANNRNSERRQGQRGRNRRERFSYVNTFLVA